MGLGALQPGHLIVVLVIVLLIFGPGKLPQLGKAVGDGLRELKNSTTGGEDTKTTTASTVTPISAGRVCWKCNNAVPAGDRFCGHCGANVDQPTRIA
jgi:sec-independent protein translocase protein TatA